MESKKTSTVTIHHDRCDPSKWTIAEWQTFARFVKDAALQDAAALSRLGIQLVLSEHHTPAGESLELIGHGKESDMPASDISDDLHEVTDGEYITAIVPIYRGPTRYAVEFGTADAAGEYDGTEHEIFDTEAEAQAFLKTLFEFPA